MEFQLDNQHQRPNELLACRDVQSGGVPGTAVRFDGGPEQDGRTDRLGELRMPRLGNASQYGSLEALCSSREFWRGISHMGELGHGRSVVLRALVGTLRVLRRSRVSS